jgi:hypothetical protein
MERVKRWEGWYESVKEKINKKRWCKKVREMNKEHVLKFLLLEYEREGI